MGVNVKMSIERKANLAKPNKFTRPQPIPAVLT